MAGHHHINPEDLQEQYVFSARAKKNIFIVLAIGLIMTVLGIISAVSSDPHDTHQHHDAEEHSGIVMGDDLAGTEGTQKLEAEGHGGSPTWLKRIKAAVWHNNVFFLGLSVIGLFFVAIQYATQSGWSAGLRRIPEAMASFLPVISVLMIASFFLVSHDVFHWTHEYLYAKEINGVENPDYDAIIAGKKPFLETWFYVLRMCIFLGGWTAFMLILRKHSLAEDREGGIHRYRKMLVISTIFIIFFAVSSSIAAWDWVMSIDTHWFSTLFGWYNFSSWFVSGLALITLIMIFLKESGYLKIVNENHFHDMGKFVFAFSIFWTYLWFSQYVLIYYANIPEETVYYIERLNSPHYGKFVFLNLLICFVFPFFGLMTRNAKRKTSILKIVAIGVILGHWFDFYLMTAPGILKEAGEMGLLEIGLPLVYAAVFAYWVGNTLTKAPLVTTKHPMIEECIHHSC